jgi:hypothetical protein
MKCTIKADPPVTIYKLQKYRSGQTEYGGNGNGIPKIMLFIYYADNLWMHNFKVHYILHMSIS